MFGQRPGPRVLRAQLASGRVIRIIGAHNPLGAVIAERVGFDGVWASGLEASASAAVPDADILTMTDLLSTTRSLVERVSIPVVADCDAGYGNVPNVINMTRKYEAAGAAAICIEDKRYPKLNSFVGDSSAHHLLPTTAFASKIVAASAVREADGMVIIARTEALIAGLSVDEALERAYAYSEAGADAVLIHDRGASPDSVLEFLGRWQGHRPTVVVPTTYHTIRATELEDAGANMVIYANHGVRAQVAATQRAFRGILRADRTTEIEDELATLQEIFDLQGVRAMLDAELDATDASEKLAENESFPEPAKNRCMSDHDGATASGHASRESMVSSGTLLSSLDTCGVTAISGVPCSNFASVIEVLENNPNRNYVSAANEGEAVSIAAGTALAGGFSAVFMQNSGLGNAVNPLTSLTETLGTRMVLFISWRGSPELRDEPQHRIMGSITPALLDLMKIPWRILPQLDDLIPGAVNWAAENARVRRGVVALLVRPGTFVKPSSRSDGLDARLSRSDVLKVVMERVTPKHAVVATTGYTSRELEASWDRAENVYVVGSMGCASSVALGIALHKIDRKVIVLDGDGAALMRLESLATIGRTTPRNLIHFILDNGSYESTGGQNSGSGAVDFEMIARASGYTEALSTTDRSVIEDMISLEKARNGPVLVRVPIKNGVPGSLGRPRRDPRDQSAAFMKAMTT
ncbi:phosphonopyruvate decarboxylase [Rathayibacter toxicus]|uniref:phosphonopyruvate decarboxylase n=1 Tax=Rathayibacter toxicus TaxID=145458 RepID=UPI000CE8A857|nr:phosphonopyruvate decarboxylase [Rathayibacter toxicus]PPI55216.1 phosphonopyruvate decarboxylase [Rathayibacter toxicus]QOD09532.1 phosphonopyruvate decarboxylase [Rathayibacter toxicus]QWL28200.1 phosphonopyruvate decarboxylase [Rathayibacter toxicus]